MDLMLEYHRRTDHGRDGAELDSLTCNCRQLFDEHDKSVYNGGHSDGYALGCRHTEYDYNQSF